MTSTAIIHIGMHKTGSSSIQNTLFDNRDYFLKTCDLNYFAIQANHSVLNHVFGDVAGLDKMPAPPGFASEDKFRAYKAGLKTDLKTAIGANTSRYFVMSGEGLSLLGDAAVQRLADFIIPFFDQVQIHVYVRDPYSYADSAGQQQIQQGATFNAIRTSTLGQFDPDAPKDPRPLVGSVFPFYRMRIEGFANSFGPDNVHIHEFNLKKFEGGNVVTDFMRRAFGIDLSRHKIEPAGDNRSLSREAVHLREALNRADANETPAKSLSAHLAKITGEKFRLPDFDYAAYADLMRDDMDWLKQATHGRVDFTKITPPETVAFTGQSVEATAQMINELSLDIEKTRIRSQIFQILWQLSQNQTRAADNIDGVINRCSDTRLLTAFANGLKNLSYRAEALRVASRAAALTPDDKHLINMKNRFKVQQAQTSETPDGLPQQE